VQSRQSHASLHNPPALQKINDVLLWCPDNEFKIVVRNSLVSSSGSHIYSTLVELDMSLGK